MRIAFLTPWTVNDSDSWSGVVHPMHRALADQADVHVIETGGISMSAVDRGVLATLGRVSKKPYLSGHALATSIKRGKFVSDGIRRSDADIVLCVAASQDIAFADFDQPVVQVTDATFRAMQGYYPLFSNLHPLSAWQGLHLSKRSQARTAAFSVASEWAKRALVDSGASPDSCHVIPFGPALQPDRLPNRKHRTGLRVLVVASDWERKGGEKALTTVSSVRAHYPNTSLTVVGNVPTKLPGWVTNLGRIGRSEMPQVYMDHDVLLELATANAGGVTLTDAHAFGMPVVATDTGGVSSIVSDGKSGVLLEPGKDTVFQAIAALTALYENDSRESLATGAYNRHRRLLNWDTWAMETSRICGDVLSRSAHTISKSCT